MTPRICVKCGDRLDRQRRKHYRSRPPDKPIWQRVCYGPMTTPVHEPARRKRVRLPMHFRHHGWQRVEPEEYKLGALLACGLRAKTYADKKATAYQEPWRRITNRPDTVTCEGCLAMLSLLVEQRLGDRLALTGGTREDAVEAARTRLTMNGVEGLVSA